MELKYNLVKRVYSKWLYTDDFTISTIIVNIIDICNYDCYYCYNKKPRTNIKLDLNKLYLFCKWYHDNINKYVNICILGGEPTLHPDLYDFCKKISDNYSTIKCIIITNFSHNIQYYNKLLKINADLILSWHSLENDRNNFNFISKLDLLPYYYFETNRIKISIMYEKQFAKKSLFVFDKLYNKYYRYMEFSIVENNHLHNTYNELYKYTNNELKEFNSRILNKQYFDSQIYKHIYFEYDNITTKYLLSQTLLNKKLVDFYDYKCLAGIDQLQIYFNGDISPCDDLYEKGIILENVYNGKFDRSKYHYRICQLHNCPCPAFSMKEKIFNK